MKTDMSLETVELHVSIPALEENRLQSREVFRNSRHRRTYMGLSVALATLAAYSAYSLNDGFAAVLSAALMLLVVPFLVWYLLTSPSSTFGFGGAHRLISGETIDYTYRLVDAELLEFSGSGEQRYCLSSLVDFGFENGELNLNFPDHLICIPAGSAGRNDIQRFAKSIELYLLKSS
jgi:hypothetical protein